MSTTSTTAEPGSSTYEAALEAQRVREQIEGGLSPAAACALEGIECFDLRGVELGDHQMRDRAYAGRDEFYPAGSQWYYDARNERNRDELASSVWWLVYEYGKLARAGKRPSRIYVDNYGGSVVAPLEAAV